MIRRAEVLYRGEPAGMLEEIIADDLQKSYIFSYYAEYTRKPISLTLPITEKPYHFSEFPPFFDGLLPEGVMLDTLLRKYKIDKNDLFSQLLAVGDDLVGAVSVYEYRGEL